MLYMKTALIGIVEAGVTALLAMPWCFSAWPC